MLKLYTKTGCPFSAPVWHKIEELGLEVEEKLITDPAVAAEEEKLGGKVQSPFLYDEEAALGLYESDAIITYLDKTYGEKESI